MFSAIPKLFKRMRGGTLILEGRVAIVTGAGSGIGRAIALTFAKEGAKVAVAEIDEALGEEATAALVKQGADALFIKTDIADARSVERMAQTVVKQWGGIDGLVNNAALATGLGGQRFDQIREEEWDRVMTINVKGVWLCCRAVIPSMRSRGGGRIVNLASDTALWGASMLLHYVASKGAVIALTRALAREVGDDQITVNAIAPGLTIVEATKSVAPARHRLYVEGRALKREQFPEDITGAVVFLLSDDAAFITGQLLAVNGGFVLH